jgi:manganese/zinc/iron transport system permease protein
MWNYLDTWIVISGALAAVACALPGCFLLLRRQSMTGDAISHAALPGIVLAFLAAHWVRHQGWMSDAAYEASRHLIIVTGAVVLGIGCAVASEWVQKLGRVEASAALGVVFTSLFALGLLLLRLVADQVDLDPDCVLYGTLEHSVLDTVHIGSMQVPRAALRNGTIALINVLAFTLLFKEFRIASFDPGLASAMGIPAHGIHYLLMAITAVTSVYVFESVGSILVISMLIVPAATAHLLTDRLHWMLILSGLLGGLSAAVGHAAALFLPGWIFSLLGVPQVSDASTAGMMTVVAGVMFLAAVVGSPRYGLASQWLRHRRLAQRITEEDILACLFRREERVELPREVTDRELARALARPHLAVRRALRRLARRGWVQSVHGGWKLTDSGRGTARQLVRAHRLWESYLAEKFAVAESLVHESAERVEHFLGPELRDELAQELASPPRDPHGSAIPGE